MRKNILVTGASGGIGGAIVRKLALNNEFNVLQQYRSNVENLYSPTACPSFKADLTIEDEVKSMFDHIHDEHGPLWGLVNVAGGSSNGMSWKLNGIEFMNVIHQNLLSTFLCCKYATPPMRTQVCGRIINISSIVALTGAAGASHYAAAKAGIIGFTKSLALELAPKNITVNALALGYFDVGLIKDIHMLDVAKIEERTPLKRLGNASEAASVVSFLLDDESAFVTGQTWNVNGGLL